MQKHSVRISGAVGGAGTGVSATRRLRRRHLRVVGPEEGAFLEMLALRQAIIFAGEDVANITPGFYALPQGGCIPMLVLREGREEAFTWVLEHRPLAGSTEELEPQWRAWVTKLHDEEQLMPTMDRAYAASRYATDVGKRRVREVLEEAGFFKESGT